MEVARRCEPGKTGAHHDDVRHADRAFARGRP
jgi:hypothetical protein